MKKFIILVVVIIILILLGYALRGNYPCDNCWTTPKSVTITLAGQNNSGKIGEAILTEVDGQIKVELKLVGATSDPQPASINRGRCDAVGEVVYPLSPVTNGSSVTTITASFLALETNLPLAVSAHNFCGNWVLE
jgi:hypothetical protein